MTMGINYENEFWLHILSDHMVFLSGTLAAKEQALIGAALTLKQHIDDIRGNLDEYTDSSDKIIALVKDIVGLKETILAGQLGVGPKVDINYPPTSVQHLIKEAKLYLFILESYNQNGEVPDISILKHNKFWIDNAAEHISDIYNMVDPKEKHKRMLLHENEHKFTHLLIKTEEYLEHYNSIGPFPAVKELINQSAVAVNILNEFFEELEAMRLQHLYANIIPDMLLDHMIREHLYYLNKIKSDYNKGEEIVIELS